MGSAPETLIGTLEAIMRTPVSFRRQSTCRLALAAAAVTLAAVPPVHAQQQGAAEEFIRAFFRSEMRGPGRDSVELYIGQMPPDIAAQLSIPPAARLLGTLRWRGSDASVVATMRASVDSTRSALDQALARQGWTPNRREAPEPSGLVPLLPSIPGMYCRGDSTFVQVMVAPRGQMQTDIRFMYRRTPDTGYSPCTPDQRRPMRPTQRFGGALPPLRPPAGATPSSPDRCAGSGRAYGMGQTMAFVSELAPTDVLGHYGRQLENAGWRPVEEPSAARSWAKTDSTGATQRVMLTVTATLSQPQCKVVALSSTGLPEP
jgi:hypothetical protein